MTKLKQNFNINFSKQCFKVTFCDKSLFFYIFENDVKSLSAIKMNFIYFINIYYETSVSLKKIFISRQFIIYLVYA